MRRPFALAGGQGLYCGPTIAKMGPLEPTAQSKRSRLDGGAPWYEKPDTQGAQMSTYPKIPVKTKQ